ncbi:MAG: PD-(D/E)XK nuclease family protein, partial [Fimbriimonadales bacterium]|nr:PD-(D/E)XK nuclease family protein [Fimbriimonadales bacterium]
ERALGEPVHRGRPSRPIQYRLSNGQCIQLCGVIDRIDLSPDRRVAMVVDYKLGSAPTLREFREGRAIQGLLYLHAVRTVLPNAEVVLAYDRLKAARRVRFVPNNAQLIQRFKRLDWEDPGDCTTLGLSQWQGAMHNLRARLTEAIGKLQSAHIEPMPGEHCRRCAFSDLCRQAQL